MDSQETEVRRSAGKAAPGGWSIVWKALLMYGIWVPVILAIKWALKW